MRCWQLVVLSLPLYGYYYDCQYLYYEYILSNDQNCCSYRGNYDLISWDIGTPVLASPLLRMDVFGTAMGHTSSGFSKQRNAINN